MQSAWKKMPLTELYRVDMRLILELSCPRKYI